MTFKGRLELKLAKQQDNSASKYATSSLRHIELFGFACLAAWSLRSVSGGKTILFRFSCGSEPHQHNRGLANRADRKNAGTRLRLGTSLPPSISARLVPESPICSAWVSKSSRLMACMF